MKEYTGEIITAFVGITGAIVTYLVGKMKKDSQEALEKDRIVINGFQSLYENIKDELDSAERKMESAREKISEIEYMLENEVKLRRKLQAENVKLKAQLAAVGI